MSMSKTPSPPLQTETAELGPCEVVFCFRSTGNCIYSYYFLFDIFWNSVYLSYIPPFGSDNLVYDYLFTCQRESQFVPDMDFFYYTFAWMSKVLKK